MIKVQEISWIGEEIISIVNSNMSDICVELEIEKLTELKNHGIIYYTMDYNNRYSHTCHYDLILNIYY